MEVTLDMSNVDDDRVNEEALAVFGYFMGEIKGGAMTFDEALMAAGKVAEALIVVYRGGKGSIQ